MSSKSCGRRRKKRKGNASSSLSFKWKIFLFMFQILLEDCVMKHFHFKKILWPNKFITLYKHHLCSRTAVKDENELTKYFVPMCKVDVIKTTEKNSISGRVKRLHFVLLLAWSISSINLNCDENSKARKGIPRDRLLSTFGTFLLTICHSLYFVTLYIICWCVMETGKAREKLSISIFTITLGNQKSLWKW